MIALGTMVALGCDDERVTAPEVIPLLITGDLTPEVQLVSITRGGQTVTDALVTVNDLAIPHQLNSPGSYRAARDLPTGPLVLEVTADGQAVQMTGIMPDTPVLTAPAAGTDFALADSITVTWTSVTSPDSFEVSIEAADFGGGSSLFASSTARELKFASGDFPGLAGRDVLITVLAHTGGSFSGPAEPDSRINIRSRSSEEAAITITP